MNRLKISMIISHLKSVSVEPAAFFLLTGILANYMVFQNFIMERMCTVELNRTTEECIEIVRQQSNDSELETELQVLTAKSRMYRSIIDHSLPLLLVIFLGCWSDFHGRKVPILLASFTPVATSIALIICSSQPSMGGFAVGFAATIVKGLCGAEVVFAMGAYSYLVDRTEDAARTIRIGMLSAGYTLGVPAGISLGGQYMKLNLEYQTCFAISGGIGLIGVFLVLLLVDNKIVNKTDPDESQGSSSLIVTVKNHLVEYVTVIFKKRPGKDRTKIIWLIVAFIFTIAPILGEFGIFYNFVRKQVGWDGPQFGDFTTYKILIGVAGVVLSMGIFSNCLQMPDAAVGFIAGLSQFGGCVIYAIANTSFLMYLAPAVDSMNGTMVVIARSMLSKLVEPSEVGKLFSFLSILEIAVPLFCDPCYSWLYSATVHIFAGSVFVLSAIFTIPPQAVFAVMMFTKEPCEKDKEESKEVQAIKSEKEKTDLSDLQGCDGNVNPGFVSDHTCK